MVLRNRYFVYHDVHLLDTFFDAGGNNNFAVVATSVVSRWLWSAFYLPTFGLVYLVRVRRFSARRGTKKTEIAKVL